MGLEIMEQLIKKTDPTVWVMSNLEEIKEDEYNQWPEALGRGIVKYHTF